MRSHKTYNTCVSFMGSHTTLNLMCTTVNVFLNFTYGWSDDDLMTETKNLHQCC